jgi:hypothetical protein
MPLPFVSRGEADALRERIVYLEAELARVNSRNEDLVNALAASNRAVVPYATGKHSGGVAVVRPRFGVNQATRRAEAAHRVLDRAPLPTTPEFANLRKRQEQELGASG